MIRQTLSTLRSINVDIAMICIVYLSLRVYLIRERKGKKTGWMLPAMLLVYAAAYIFILFYRVPYRRPRANLIPFWSYYTVISGGPRSPSWWLAREILQNILLFIPLGMVLSCAFTRHRIRSPILICITLSVLTEITQYITRTGLAEFDDVFNNTLGCLTGALIIRAARKRINRDKGADPLSHAKEEQDEESMAVSEDGPVDPRS